MSNYQYNQYDEDQVKKKYKKIKKVKLKKKFKIALVIIFLGLIIFFFMSDYSKVKSIRIVGQEILTEDEVLDVISINKSTQYLFMSTGKVEKEVKTLARVKDVQVSRDLFGNVSIKIKEADPLAYAIIGNKTYEINDVGNIAVVNDEKRKSFLKSLPSVSGFKDEKLLKEFAKEFKDIPNVMLNEISDVILEPQKADPTRLKFVMQEGILVYVRIEDISSKIGSGRFDYEANKIKNKNVCVYKIEGKNIYQEKCK